MFTLPLATAMLVAAPPEGTIIVLVGPYSVEYDIATRIVEPGGITVGTSDPRCRVQLVLESGPGGTKKVVDINCYTTANSCQPPASCSKVIEPNPNNPRKAKAWCDCS